MADTVTLHVKLEGKKVSRTLQIEAGDSLHELASLICRAFDFDLDHAFGFYSETKGYRYHASKRKFELFADMGEGSEGARPVSSSTVLEAFPKVATKMLYLFDYGDEWRFIVTREKDALLVPGARTPRIVASHGKAPAQYPDSDDA